MTTTNNKAERITQEVISLRSTLQAKMIGAAMNLDPDSWLNAKAGTDVLEFSVGQTVITTGKGAFTAGKEMTVKLAFIDNGNARYLAGGVYHHQGDLQAVSQ